MKAMTLKENPPKIKKGMVCLGNHPLEVAQTIPEPEDPE
jgi:hypothetical protein